MGGNRRAVHVLAVLVEDPHLELRAAVLRFEHRRQLTATQFRKQHASCRLQIHHESHDREELFAGSVGVEDADEDIVRDALHLCGTRRVDLMAPYLRARGRKYHRAHPGVAIKGTGGVRPVHPLRYCG